MRELTFTGYLTKYVRALSVNDTNSLQKLSEEAAWENPRLREPLFLYALFADKAEVLLRATKDAKLNNVYQSLLHEYSKDSMARALQNDDSALPTEYRKVWKSYLSRKNRQQGDDETKELMRRRVLQLQEKAGITNYRIYRGLNLNPGNVNAWLKHGSSEKVSLDTARSVLRFVEDACRMKQ